MTGDPPLTTRSENDDAEAPAGAEHWREALSRDEIQALLRFDDRRGAWIMVSTWGGSMWIGIPFGLALCVVFALALGVPTLRLRSDYFAITTIAAATTSPTLFGLTLTGFDNASGSDRM